METPAVTTILSQVATLSDAEVRTIRNKVITLDAERIRTARIRRLHANCTHPHMRWTESGKATRDGYCPACGMTMTQPRGD